MRVTTHRFTLKSDKSFELHPPFLYNSIKSEFINAGEEMDKIVLDAIWWKRAREHSFSVTTQKIDYEIDEFVEKAVDKWTQEIGVEGDITEYGFKEINPYEEEVPEDIDLVLLETRSPMMFGFRKEDGERRYARPNDMEDFDKITLQLIRRYKELYGKMKDETFEKVMDFSSEPENVMYYFEYVDDFPLRKDKSLHAKKAMVGKTLFRNNSWIREILRLFKLGENMHLGQKTGYGLGGVDITFLKQGEH